MNSIRDRVRSPTSAANSQLLIGNRQLSCAILVASILVLPTDALGQLEPYRDRRLSVEQRARDLLGRMTLEEKFWQLYMTPGDLDNPAHDWSHGVFGLQIRVPDSASPRAHAERINTIQRFFVERTRLGIPMIPFEEAVHGLLAPAATMYPAAIGLASTWDTALMERVVVAIAREARSRGVRQVLSPVVNLTRDPRWGRTEETYGEDHHLAALMGAAYVRAIETHGIVATPKHFIANVGEGGRDSWPIEMAERQLREVWFPPFGAAIQAGARSIMTAYNSVDGQPATQNHALLTGTLRGRSGFRGFVISDMSATGGATVLHMTEPDTPAAAAHAWGSGLDVVFQSSWPEHRPYLDAVRRRLVPPATLDSAVLRVLHAKLELGLFEEPYVLPDSAAEVSGNASHRALALDAARAALVLLANERGTLPLAGSLGSLAVIGPDAREPRLGGYSGPGARPESILEALRARLPRARIRYAPGPGRIHRSTETIESGAFSGLRGEYFDNPDLAGTPKIVRADERVDFSWTLDGPGAGISRDWFAVRWTGAVTVPDGRPRRIGVEGNDGYRLWIDGKLLIDNARPRSYGGRLSARPLAPGRHELRLEYREPQGNGRIRLVWDAVDRSREDIDSAVRVARASDATILVAGIEEGEFRDRAALGLPGRQEELIHAVAATGKPVVVVLIGGSAVTMPWLEKVGAVLMAWYPGEAGGVAVAEALLGDVNPGGRLPITFPLREGQLPLYYNHKPTGRGDDYVDLTGRPLFPFGFGLSYTTFAYADLAITEASDGGFHVRARVMNTGARAGDEVVQLYLRDELASVARPVMQLAGFARVSLKAGASTVVEFPVARAQLSLLDANMNVVVEPGTWRVMIGSSSRDIRLKGVLTVK